MITNTLYIPNMVYSMKSHSYKATCTPIKVLSQKYNFVLISIIIIYLSCTNLAISPFFPWTQFQLHILMPNRKLWDMGNHYYIGKHLIFLLKDVKYNINTFRNQFFSPHWEYDLTLKSFILYRKRHLFFFQLLVLFNFYN